MHLIRHATTLAILLATGFWTSGCDRREPDTPSGSPAVAEVERTDEAASEPEEQPPFIPPVPAPAEDPRVSRMGDEAVVMLSLIGHPEQPAFMGEPLSEPAIAEHAGRRGVVRINFKTDSEKDTFGFYVLRADDVASSPVRINQQMPIAGAGESSAPRYYSFFDLTVEVGRTYYYGLEEITLGGKITPMLEQLVPIKVRSLYLDPDATPAAP